MKTTSLDILEQKLSDEFTPVEAIKANSKLLEQRTEEGLQARGKEAEAVRKDLKGEALQFVNCELFRNLLCCRLAEEEKYSFELGGDPIAINGHKMHLKLSGPGGDGGDRDFT